MPGPFFDDDRYVQYYTPPFGLLMLESTEDVLLKCKWVENKDDRPETETRPILEKAKEQLGGYFDGSLRTFNLSIDARGTLFQKKVWQALRDIPYGDLITFQEVAEMVDNPNAARAVGRAANKNPLQIIIPSHRVVAASGLITNNAGGIELKKKLMALERKFLREGH